MTGIDLGKRQRVAVHFNPLTPQTAPERQPWHIGHARTQWVDEQAKLAAIVPPCPPEGDWTEG